MFYTYIITNKHLGTLYIGHTNDLVGRMWEHKERLYGGFAKKYNLDKLIWYHPYHNRHEAFVKERQMKEWNRQWKINAIETINPGWKDLDPELCQEYGLDAFPHNIIPPQGGIF